MCNLKEKTKTTNKALKELIEQLVKEQNCRSIDENELIINKKGEPIKPECTWKILRVYIERYHLAYIEEYTQKVMDYLEKRKELDEN